MRSNAGISTPCLDALSAENTNNRLISTSEVKISVAVDAPAKADTRVLQFPSPGEVAEWLKALPC